MPVLSQLSQLGRPPKILLLGSGGLSIGQAGEFDYSGTQAVKAFLEEGAEVIIINPNIATVQTNPAPGKKVYLYPVEPAWVTKIIEIEQPDAIVGGFGGQTALNCLLKLDETGVLKKHNVLNLGTTPDSLRMTEDRDLFARKMKEINMPVPPSVAASSMDEALKAAKILGYPMIVRAAYALGGLGSGFAASDDELRALVEPALASSPQVLLEKSLKGWKELEYEVMRDSEGNTITICNMENFDPLGIHTGDSIVVCPSQSLSDEEYQTLRNACLSIVNATGIIGECNVQFALSPHNCEFFVIEMNARLSRSSALASKASGYPIAYIAAKVVMGYDLIELKNPVTGITSAFFEPALDYITVKFPRWDLTKFRGANRELGSTMKSVGEVMSIGRTFPEALQKAVRMVTETPAGISAKTIGRSLKEIESRLSSPTDTRLFDLIGALREGMTMERAHELTQIDKWFLANVARIVELERDIRVVGKKVATSTGDLDGRIAAGLAEISTDVWHVWKRFGFGDEQITMLMFDGMGVDRHKLEERAITQASMVVRKLRKAAGVIPVVKKIDTTAAEYPSPSNYLYMTYAGSFDDPIADESKGRKTAIVLGGGPYRIGTSVEFDWCAVACSERLRAGGWRSVILNCNPETVSTDYNLSDTLYFEEMTLERVLDIIDREQPEGVVATMGGQLPNRLALPLAQAGVKLLGHPAEAVDCAEDRHKFSKLLDSLGIDQPAWTSATSSKDLRAFAKEVGYPVLVRPSYVLSGAAMMVCYNDEGLETAMANAADISRDHPVVVSQFLEGAREIEFDGVARAGEVVAGIVSEHIENAGTHSGDATVVVPAQRLYVETVRQVRKSAAAIARGLGLNGPFNIQFIAVHNRVRVIECNARAARSFPFVSKVASVNLAALATDVLMGKPVSRVVIEDDEMPYTGVKAAMFSFPRLRGADPILGVEMASTGEVGCLARTFDEAMLLAMEAAKVYPPRKAVLVSAGGVRDKLKFLKPMAVLKELGLKVYATPGTAAFLKTHGYEVEALAWPGEGEKDVIRAIREGWVDFVINIPKNVQRQELTWGAKIRMAASQYGRSLMTDMEKATAYIEALGAYPKFVTEHRPIELPPYAGQTKGAL